MRNVSANRRNKFLQLMLLTKVIFTLDLRLDVKHCPPAKFCFSHSDKFLKREMTEPKAMNFQSIVHVLTPK